MIFKEDNKKKKKKTKTGNTKQSKAPKRCRDYENLTCGKKGRPTHLLSLWESFAGELEARKTASKNAAEKHCNKQTDGKENPPPSPDQGRPFSLFLFVAKGI
jgi:hypothetical protein